MTRKEFIKICSLFGIGLPFQGMFLSCKKDEDISTPFSGKVLIIGAGAGGLSAGYFLKQQGTDFEIIEASSAYGGRMRKNTSFSDFPIPLGAEWLLPRQVFLLSHSPTLQPHRYWPITDARAAPGSFDPGATLVDTQAQQRSIFLDQRELGVSWGISG